MTRKELVEQAFEKLAIGNEEQRFLAIRAFKKSLEYQDVNKSFPDAMIEFYIILTELSDSLEVSKKDVLDYFFNHIRLYGREGADPYLNEAVKGSELKYKDKSKTELRVDETLKKFIQEDLGRIWLKSIKYDMFLAKMNEMKNRVQLEKQDILQLEQMFQSFENNLLE
jgi:hypothetical protein